MSRKMLAVAAVALMALPLTAAHSQLSFGVAAGMSMPNGVVKDDLESGYHLMGILGISPPALPVGLRIDGMFNEFKFKSTSATDQKFRVMALTANAVLSMPGAMVLSPYAIGGLGMYNTSFSPKIVGEDSQNDLGFNIGAGVKFGLAGFGAFGEVRWHQIQNDGTDKIRFIPITFGIIF